MYSSRMLQWLSWGGGVCPGGCPWGVSTWGVPVWGYLLGGCLHRGVCLGVSAQGGVSPGGCFPRGCTPPCSVNRITDRCKKHYLLAASFAEGKKTLTKISCHAGCQEIDKCRTRGEHEKPFLCGQ